MNDYTLINALLEDGSEQSKMKLKMIVDFSWFDLQKISQHYRFEIVKLFADDFDKEFTKYPWLIEHYDKIEQEYIKKMFADVNFTKYNNVQTVNFIT